MVGKRRWPAVGCIVALAAVAISGPVAGASAQEPSARAYISPSNTVGLGAPFVLNVEIVGAQRLDSEPAIPDLSAFAQYVGSSTQTSMQSAGGRTTVSFTVQYRHQALTEGAFEIPAFDVTVGGQTFTTQPIPVTVSASATGAGNAAAGVSAEDLLVTAEATRTRVLDGEPFVVEYRIWTRVNVSSFNFTRVPEPEGFWVEDITPQGQPQVEQLVRNGQQYASAVIRRVVLIPTGSGPKTIQPIVMEAQVQTAGSDPFDRFFGSSRLFGNRTVPVGVVSDSLTITVDPLPAGAPAPFSGIVGRLDVTASLDRDSIDANEAVTLTVTVSGDGNIRSIPEPVIDFPEDFEVFPPEIAERVSPAGTGVTGSKVYEYVVIPRAPGAREIPAISMGYYATSSNSYERASSAPIPLTVTGTLVEGPTPLARGGVEQLRRDIRFIHLGVTLRPQSGSLFGAAPFWLFLLLPLVALAGAVGLRRHQDLLEGDVAYARGRRAGRVAKQRLAAARGLASEGDARAFYAEVARALRGLVADKSNIAEAGLQQSELGPLLDRSGVSAPVRDELLACLDHCDRQRFAPPGDDPEEKNRFLDRASEVMTSLHKELG